MSKQRLALIECYFTKSNSQDPLGGNPVKNREENEFYILFHGLRDKWDSADGSRHWPESKQIQILFSQKESKNY